MYIDLEGVNLSRDGSLSILTLLIDTGIPNVRVCLIDVHLLGAQAFNTAGIKQKTLKDIFQDGEIPKVFFDVRNDSDTLFAHFGVALQGVEDIQLMESATRTTTKSRRFLNGLAKCIENYAPDNFDRVSWKLVKKKGEQLFKTEHGGSVEVFNQRPILDDIVSYCVGDVQCLPLLWDKFQHKTYRWRDLVNQETKKRVAASHKPEYKPHGAEKSLAPWSEDQNRMLDDELSHEYDYYDDMANSKDCIDECDYHFYYSD
jgi:exonuclease 3'-5' domain-containing protein 1